MFSLRKYDVNSIKNLGILIASPFILLSVIGLSGCNFNKPVMYSQSQETDRFHTQSGLFGGAPTSSLSDKSSVATDYSSSSARMIKSTPPKSLKQVNHDEHHVKSF